MEALGSVYSSPVSLQNYMVGRSAFGLKLGKAVSHITHNFAREQCLMIVLGTFAFYVKGRRTTAPERPRGNDRRASGEPPSPKEKGVSSSVSLPTRSKDLKNEEITALQILLVEDNLVNQKVLSKQLMKAGCVVHVANHGVEALEFLEKSRLWRDNPEGYALDIVLMDLEMPVMDGLTCARRIRELQTEGTLMAHVPLIAVTANARKEQIATSISAGMVSHRIPWTLGAHSMALC